MISDFGAALLRKAQAVQTAAMGSPYYMSPEQIEGKTLTLHSDMYSLGVSLYELLTGSRPFTGTTMDELLGKILHDDPAPPSSIRADLPRDIDRIILLALVIGGGMAMLAFGFSESIASWFSGTPVGDQFAALLGTFSLRPSGYLALAAQAVLIAAITAWASRRTLCATLDDID